MVPAGSWYSRSSSNEIKVWACFPAISPRRSMRVCFRKPVTRLRPDLRASSCSSLSVLVSNESVSFKTQKIDYLQCGLSDYILYIVCVREYVGCVCRPEDERYTGITGTGYDRSGWWLHGERDQLAGLYNVTDPSFDHTVKVKTSRENYYLFDFAA